MNLGIKCCGTIKKECIHRIFIAVFIAAYTIFSIHNDLKFFYWDRAYNPLSMQFYIVIKVIFVLLMLLLGMAAYKRLSHVRISKSLIKENFAYYGIIAIVYIAVLIALWPGNWGAVGDEVQVFLSVKNLRVWPDQGIMSSLFMLLCIMIYPDPGIIAAVQVIISVVVIGNIIKSVSLELENKIIKYFLIVLFITLPALCFVTCPIRIWLYSIFLILLIENLFLIKKEKDENIFWNKAIIVSVLLSVVVNYRSEGLLFALISPLVILLSRTAKKYKIKALILLISSLVVVTVFLRVLVKLGNGNTLNQHSGLKYVTVLSTILSDPEKYKKIAPEDIENIDKVYDIETMLDNASMSSPFNGTIAERSFPEPTAEEMKAFKKSVYNIILKNIPTYLECRWEAAKWSLGVYPYYPTVGFIWNQETIDEWSRHTDLPGDISGEFRRYDNNSFREYISEKLVFSFNIKGVMSFYIFYAFWLPCILIPLMFIINLIKRDYFESGMCFALFLQLVMVVLMAPGRYQMYYLPFYFLGWIMLLRTIFKKNRPILNEAVY